MLQKKQHERTLINTSRTDLNDISGGASVSVVVSSQALPSGLVLHAMAERSMLQVKSFVSTRNLSFGGRVACIGSSVCLIWCLIATILHCCRISPSISTLDTDRTDSLASYTVYQTESFRWGQDRSADTTLQTDHTRSMTSGSESQTDKSRRNLSRNTSREEPNIESKATGGSGSHKLSSFTRGLNRSQFV